MFMIGRDPPVITRAHGCQSARQGEASRPGCGHSDGLGGLAVGIAEDCGRQQPPAHSGVLAEAPSPLSAADRHRTDATPPTPRTCRRIRVCQAASADPTREGANLLNQAALALANSTSHRIREILSNWPTTTSRSWPQVARVFKIQR